jgi:hypothetical protein
MKVIEDRDVCELEKMLHLMERELAATVSVSCGMLRTLMNRTLSK